MAIVVELSPRMEQLVNELVATGRFSSKNEVLQEGLRLLDEREKKLAALDAALARGLADIDAGRMRPVDEVFDELRARYAPGKAG